MHRQWRALFAESKAKATGGKSSGDPVLIREGLEPRLDGDEQSPARCEMMPPRLAVT